MEPPPGPGNSPPSTSEPRPVPSSPGTTRPLFRTALQRPWQQALQNQLCPTALFLPPKRPLSLSAVHCQAHSSLGRGGSRQRPGLLGHRPQRCLDSCPSSPGSDMHWPVCAEHREDFLWYRTPTSALPLLPSLSCSPCQLGRSPAPHPRPLPISPQGCLSISLPTAAGPLWLPDLSGPGLPPSITHSAMADGTRTLRRPFYLLDS